MVFAIAALLFQFGSVVPAVPAAAASAAAAAKPAPSSAARTATVTNLPEAPIPPRTTPDALPVSSPAPFNPFSEESTRPEALLRSASLNTPGTDAQVLSTIRIPESNKPMQRIGVEEMPSRRSWLALSFAQSGAAAFDAYSTRRAVENGAREEDPAIRPFANSPAIYAAIQVGPVLLDYTARHMQRSEVPFVRHTWWVPQALGTGIYLFAGAHNMSFVNRR